MQTDLGYKNLLNLLAPTWSLSANAVADWKYPRNLRGVKMFLSLFSRKRRAKLRRERREYAVLKRSVLFSPLWYMQEYSLGSRDWDPILHYIRYGWRMGYRPGPSFDGARYLAANPGAGDVNPLWHFLVFGVSQGRFEGASCEPLFVSLNVEPQPTTSPSALADLPVARQFTAEEIARRILVADCRTPRANISAGEKATFGLIKDLCAVGFDVTFLPNDMEESPGYDDQLRALGVHVVSRADGYQWPAQFIDAKGHEYGAFYLIRFDVAEPLLAAARRVAPKARVIFHAPDLYFLRETREAELKCSPDALARARQTRDRELDVMRASDRVVLVSPAEIPYIRAELPDAPISVFPALYSEIRPNPPGYSARHDIFFLGGFAHTPNVDAVLWFVEKVWPRIHKALPEVLFNIVGSEMPKVVLDLSRTPGVKIVGFAPDLDPILEGSRLSVAPLLFGAGIKGKVGAAMGGGVPCVCTPIGAEGMGIVDRVHALVAKEPDAFADAVIELYTDQALWTRVAANGRALVDQRFGDAANRASFLKVLNDARIMPISLFSEYCKTAGPVALPVHDPALIPDVSIILSACNRWARTRSCLNSVAITSADFDLRYEIILADDGSFDETARAAEIYPGLRVAKTSKNLGILRERNNVAKLARGKYLVLLNDDTIVLPGWLKALHQAMESDEDIAIGGSRLLGLDGSIQEAGAALFRDGTAVHVGRGSSRDTSITNIPREVDTISGASIIVRRDFWESTGGFDERYENADCAVSDLAMSARAAGKYVRYQPASEVILDIEEAPLDNTGLTRQNIKLLQEKWCDVFQRDHLPMVDWQVAANNAERSLPKSARVRRRDGQFNILYFSPFPSHPSNHGNAATIHQFGRRFQTLGHNVHFALLKSDMYDPEALKAMKEAWDTLDIIENSNSLVSDGHAIPFDGWYQEGVGEDIRLLCAKFDIDVVFCSYIFQSKLLEFVPSYMLKVIDTHDKMGGRYDMLRANRQPLEFFSCTPEEEGRYLRRADVVVARREEEARYFNSVTGRQSAIVIPHVEDQRFIDRKFRQLSNIGLVASPNRINVAIVKEFVETISRRCGDLCPFTVHIAGQVKDLVDQLPPDEAAVFRASWIRFHGFVEDIETFYRRMDAVVSPITMGTGINVKTVQAMAFGMPLISTKWGSKGIESDEPMHNFDGVESLVVGLLNLVKTPEELVRLAKVSCDRYKTFYDEAGEGFSVLFAHEKLRCGSP